MPSSTGQDDRLYIKLAHDLRAGGFGKVANADASPLDWNPVPDLLLVLGTLPGNMAGLHAVGVAWPVAAIAGLVLAAVPFLLGIKSESDELISSTYLLPPIAAFIVVAVDSGWIVLLTNALPAALGVVGSVIAERFEPISPKRTLEAVKTVLKDLPLLFPLVALVLFALIMTSEIWEVANTESEIRLAILAALVIAPVTWQLRRTLVDEIEPAFEQTAAATIADADSVKAVAHALHADTDADALTDRELERIRTAFERADAQVLERLACDVLLSTFRRRVTRRLVLTVVLVGVAAFVLILALTWLAVADEVAADWVGGETTPAEIPDWEPLGLLAVPLGPYLKVSALLATLSVAVFCAFVITNQDLFDRLRDGYIQRPAAAALLLAVPYVAERDRLEAAARARENPLVPA